MKRAYGSERLKLLLDDYVYEFADLNTELIVAIDIALSDTHVLCRLIAGSLLLLDEVGTRKSFSAVGVLNRKDVR